MRQTAAVIRLVFSVAAATFMAGAPGSTQAVAPTYIALKIETKHPPSPEDGLVTLTLSSGARVRLRAGDIDYERTAA